MTQQVLSRIGDALTHPNAAALSIGAAVLSTVADGVKQGHVSWPAVELTLLTAIAGVAKSALAARNVKS